MLPLISVIVPVYNAEPYLDKCIQSIIDQSYRNLEIILVDDGSSDRSPAICDSYAVKDHRVQVIHKENGGQSSARNVGLDICQGDFIGFVDSDDYIAPQMYERLLALCNDRRTVAMANAAEVTKCGDVIREDHLQDGVFTQKQYLENVLCHIDRGSVCTKLFPKDVIRKTRFEESKLNEDLLFLVYITQEIEMLVTTSYVGYYCLCRTGSTSRQFGKAIRDMIENSIEIRHFVNERFPELYDAAERFEIAQHMTFLFSCPVDHDRKTDRLYREVFSSLKKHRMAGLKNPYFSAKEKAKLLGVSFCPKLMSRLLEGKRRRANGAISK